MRRTVRPRTHVLMGAVLALALAPGTASALLYDNTDPSTTGCSGDAYTLTSAPVLREDTSAIVGTVELRWSRTCATGWSRFTPAAGANIALAGARVIRPSDAAEAEGWSLPYANDWPHYGNQLNGSATCISATAIASIGWHGGGTLGIGQTGCAGGTPPTGSYPETTGGATATWSDPATAGGTQGPPIGANATVHVACKLTGFRVANGNTWWYRIASSPWGSAYYASADAFYNNGRTSGSLSGTPFVDLAVRDC